MDPPQSSSSYPINVTKEDHNRFIKSLEKHGSKMNGKEWSQIAADMKWTVDDVKAYAYWYMQQLHQIHHQDDNDIYQEQFLENTKADGNPKDCEDDKNSDNIDDGSLDEEWSYEEIVLFNTLLVTYDSNTTHRWGEIASLIPFKTEAQCKKRWHRINVYKKK